MKNRPHKPKNRCPLVLVEWLDSIQPQPNWQHLASMETAEPVRCYSVGWLVSGDGETKALAPNLGVVGDDNVQISGVITIPARSITKITPLKESRVKWK